MSKPNCYFCATKEGQRPEELDVRPQWHQNKSLAADLLEKMTRNTALKFESSKVNETIELKKLEGNSLRKRKRHGFFLI
jgi:hypothetical protein